ncbi:Agamous-like MADS-box protein AGL80 [Glycine max]|nr:Agamous-like MADS-box protein AGL80 [Glycine max]
MARKKLRHTYINNPLKRKTTFKKRKNGFLKKVDEITTLSDIRACAIIYTLDEPEPKVWPSNQGLESVISRFRGVSELAQSKRMLCQENLLKRNIMKAQGKLMNEIKKKEIGLFMCQYFASWNNLDNANIIDQNDITLLANKKLEITKKNEILQVQEVTPAIENGGETMTEGEQTLVANVDAMPNLNWSNDNIDDGDGDGIDVKIGRCLLKKVGEITTLCDIQACAIIYTPDEPKAEVWPYDQRVDSVISRFRGVFELAISKRINIIKAQGQLKKLRNENRKKEIGLFMCQYFDDGNNTDNDNIIDLNNITFLVDKKLEEITKKIEML